MGEKFSLSLSCAALGSGRCRHHQDILLSSPMCPNSCLFYLHLFCCYILLRRCAGTSLLAFWTPQRLSCLGGDWFMVLLGPPDRGPDQLVPRSICLLPGPRVGGAPPWSLGIWGSWEDQRHKGLQPNPPSSGVVPESMAGTPVSESAAGVSLLSQNASPYSWTKKAGNETSRM